MLRLRSNIFETNSSTTHSLTIARNKVTPEVIEEFKKEHGTHIIFGLYPYEKIEKVLWENLSIDENTPFQVKADILYLSMYLWSSGYSQVAEYMIDKKKLQDKLSELGFTVEFREDPKLFENYEYQYHRDDVDENLFENMWHDINEVIDFLFGDHVLYYTWCDECMSKCPEKINQALDRFMEYGKTEEHQTYMYR